MENIKTIVCRNFNRLVDSSGKTKREIAQQMNISEATLQRWKNGISFPELPNIEKLAVILKVQETEFYKTEESVAQKAEPVSIFAKKLMAIPDEVYDYAQDISLDNKIWGHVKTLLEDAAKTEREIRSIRLNKG